MKFNNITAMTRLIANRLGLNFRNRRRVNYQRRMWNPIRTGNVPANKRIKQWNSIRPIEINKAVGGNKSLRYNGPKIAQTINFYAKIRYNPNNNDRYEFVYNESNSEKYDLKAQLNDSDEFLTLRKQAIQYNVVNVAISFNYNRVPQAKEKWAKMILTPETDKVERSEYTINNNGMAWDMTSNGTKNYNFRINNTNTDDEDAQWIIGQAQFNGQIDIWIDSQGENYVPAEQITFDRQLELGDLKISVQIVYYHKDIADVSAKAIERTRYTKREQINIILDKLSKIEKLYKNEAQDVE